MRRPAEDVRVTSAIARLPASHACESISGPAGRPVSRRARCTPGNRVTVRRKYIPGASISLARRNGIVSHRRDGCIDATVDRIYPSSWGLSANGDLASSASVGLAGPVPFRSISGDRQGPWDFEINGYNGLYRVHVAQQWRELHYRRFGNFVSWDIVGYVIIFDI